MVKTIMNLVRNPKKIYLSMSGSFGGSCRARLKQNETKSRKKQVAFLKALLDRL